MLTNKNDITIHRGESFTIHKTVVNRDGSPYIVSSELQNPFWLLSVSDSLSSQHGRMVNNYWLPVGPLSRFPLTQPISLSKIHTSATSGVRAYGSFDDIKSFPVTGYYEGAYVSLNADTCVFEDAGVYKYARVESGKVKWYDYSCEIIKTFFTEDTKDWIAQNYYYSIQLVTGTLNEDGILGHIGASYPILSPSRIQVKEYAQGGIYNA